MENMTRIKPSHYEVYPIYRCTCGAEWQQTVEETVFPAGILCHCGAKLKLATIEDLQVKASFKTDRKPDIKPVSEPVSEPPENYEQKNDIYEEVVPALVSMGFKKREAKNLIDKYYVEGVTPEDLVGEILRGR
jgi:hypothetical protein